MNLPTGTPRRRRRTPEAAQREIIDAAESLLRERPFRELTVDEVMRRTELSRPSFYVYFKDRHELVLRVVQHLFSELFTPTSEWFESSGPDQMGIAIDGAVDVYLQHGPVLRALADAAADDVEVEKAYLHLVESFVMLLDQQIRDEKAAGTITIEGDAHEIATVIVWMYERYFYLRLNGPEDRDTVAETLKVMQRRILYGI